MSSWGKDKTSHVSLVVEILSLPSTPEVWDSILCTNICSGLPSGGACHIESVKLPHGHRVCFLMAEPIKKIKPPYTEHIEGLESLLPPNSHSDYYSIVQLISSEVIPDLVQIFCAPARWAIHPGNNGVCCL
jgi:hypothetical protein